jgi:hypothetical protein
MDDLSEEQKAQALHAARSGIIDLMAADPALGIRFGADDLAKVYLAGVLAGVDAAGRVFDVIARELDL